MSRFLSAKSDFAFARRIERTQVQNLTATGLAALGTGSAVVGRSTGAWPTGGRAREMGGWIRGTDLRGEGGRGGAASGQNVCPTAK